MGFSRKVVIKRIRPDKVAEPLFVERFIREATISSQFHHPNIVEILELVTQDDAYYIVMEFLHGMHLGKIIERMNRARGHCPPDVAAHIASSLASACDYAHNFVGEDGKMHEIVHRDISPENVMVTYNGEVKLVDFGVAKDMQGTMLTQGDQVIGKPLYLPPEALEGKPASAARDVYSLGMTIYVLLAGRPPFDSRGGPEGLAKLMLEISTKEVPPLSEFNPKVPQELEDVTAGCLRKDPNKRMTAAEATRVLEEYLGAQSQRTNNSSVAAFVRSLVDDESELQPKKSRTTGPILSPTPTPNPMPPPPPPTPTPAPVSEERTHIAQEATIAASRKSAQERKKKRATDVVFQRPNAGEPGGLRVRWVLGGAGALLFFILLVALWPSGPDLPTAVGPVSTANGVPVPVPQPIPIAPDAPTEPVVPRPKAGVVDRIEGTVTIKCGKWGWIAIDGRRVGFCPSVTKKVKIGKHTVTLDENGNIKSKEVLVLRDRPAVVDFRPPRKHTKEPDITIRPAY